MKSQIIQKKKWLDLSSPTSLCLNKAFSSSGSMISLKGKWEAISLQLVRGRFESQQINTEGTARAIMSLCLETSNNLWTLCLPVPMAGEMVAMSNKFNKLEHMTGS